MDQRDGYMCAQLMNPDRPKWTDPLLTTVEAKAAAADGAFAHCGRYEIDVQQRWIMHLPEVATDPGYVGSRQIRPFSFEAGRLILSDVEKNDAAVARWKIIWEKVPCRPAAIASQSGAFAYDEWPPSLFKRQCYTSSSVH